MLRGAERELTEVPPCMCCVAWVPPTAAREPAAWREPEVEIKEREDELGEAK